VLRVGDGLTDGLARSGEAARGDASEHLLEHELRERITVGEVRVGRHRDLAAAAVCRAHARALTTTRRPPSVTWPALWP
jgi:hypothetical protein